jgi:hypothetical protein|tara:strand:- start:82 stop:249 length:168 start_codon:yes stop_codon:yes gene_type:complete
MSQLHEDILELLKERSGEEGYVNPHFLQIITTSLFDYYEIEDDTVDSWVAGMYEM